MGDRLRGKVAIVTGAGSRGPGLGNGKAAAILFAREGASVLCVDRELPRAEETVELIRAEGGEATALAADVTRADDCRAMVGAATRAGAASTSSTTTSGSSPARISSRRPRRSGTRSSRSISSRCSSRPGLPCPRSSPAAVAR